jgi:hypothetical protein
LENNIKLHLRDRKYSVGGVAFRIVRKFIFYEPGGGPGLVWDRERDNEEGITFSVSDL